MRRRIIAVVLTLAPCAWPVGIQAQDTAPSVTQSAGADSGDGPPRMKTAPYLEPPPAKALKPTPNTTLIGNDREAIFLRADRLEGEGNKWIEAEGNAELRSRRQSVLADWIH